MKFAIIKALLNLRFSRLALIKSCFNLSRVNHAPALVPDDKISLNVHLAISKRQCAVNLKEVFKLFKSEKRTRILKCFVLKVNNHKIFETRPQNIGPCLVWPLDQHCLFIDSSFLTLHNNLVAYATLVRSFESYQDAGLVKRSMLAWISGFHECNVDRIVYTNEWDCSTENRVLPDPLGSRYAHAQ